MAIDDINIFNQVESLQRIVIPEENKERKKQKQGKSANKEKEKNDTTENNQQNKVTDNDKHLLDFKA
ncbi:MAG TPA: hypothetical protein PLP05_01270 [Sedimentisphaerales bacterium]|nr:hypothetical protein [Sedimentisphaerales bacterium]